jgi:tetratricopeptide (TPR) repeat protein
LGILLAAALLAEAGEAQPDGAVAFWERRVARDPDDFISATKLGEACLRQARLTGDLTFHTRAESSLKAALALSPGHVPALVNLASVAQAQHRFREAASLGRKALALQANEPAAYAVWGDASLELGDLAEAEQATLQLHRLSPGLASFSRRARLRWLRGDAAGALADLQQASEAGERDGARAEDHAWCRVERGQLLFRVGDFAGADLEYQTALKLCPGSHLALTHLAELRAAQQRFPEAIRLYESVIDRLPRPDYQQALGDLLAFLGRKPEAAVWHERALAGLLRSAAAGSAIYWHHLAAFYCDVREDPVEALRWARLDVAARASSTAYEALAWALHKAGEPVEALAAIQKALAPGTRDSHLLYRAALIHLEAGRLKEGKELLRAADAANPFRSRFHAHR